MSSADVPPNVPVPLADRVLLHHAAVQYVADEIQVPILHFKGPLVAATFPHDGQPRRSTDVDVFLRSEDLDALSQAMLGHGWVEYDKTIEAEWHHSRVLEHPEFACTVDLHTHYPGIHLGVTTVFDILDRDHEEVLLAARVCHAPARPVHGLLILLHAARGDSGQKGQTDIRRVIDSLTPAEMDHLLAVATELGCRPALSSVLPISPDSTIEGQLWADIMRNPQQGALRWVVRLIEADSWRQRRDVLRAAVIYPEKGSGPGGGVSLNRIWRGARQLPGIAVRLASYRRSR
ncbi:nucleotidyltransferase family protein [Demetria terragena]|uniref:nucleotidyltransferase family protein n=1 Tax=Demetria terragena TaxID=63959 RepID=UPI00035D1CA0|nr:nucleotidyltransferase family protein [Demetria terragena]